MTSAKHLRFNVTIAATVAVLLAILFTPMIGMADSGEYVVTATSSITIEPDYAIVVVGYTAHDEDSVRAALTEVGDTIDSIIAALKTNGVDPSDIATTNMNVETLYSYEGSYAKTAGFRASNNVSVTVRDIARVSDVLNAAFEAGANTSYGLTFRSTKEGEAYLLALEDAIKTAKSKAELVAATAGVPLGKLIGLKENTGNRYYGVEYSNSMVAGYARDAGKLAGTISSGLIELSAEVEMVFEVGR